MFPLLTVDIGGMPTPKRTLIPVTMQLSTWLTPLPGKDTVYLPFDIPIGGTKRIAHEIWAKIKSPSTQPDSTAFKAVSTIKLQAIVPDLDRRLPHFEPSQNISIQYPVKFVSDEFKWMDTISQGSSTSLQWTVCARESVRVWSNIMAKIFIGHEHLVKRSRSQQSLATNGCDKDLLSNNGSSNIG